MVPIDSSRAVMGFCKGKAVSLKKTEKDACAPDLWPEARAQLTPEAVAGARELFAPIAEVLPSTHLVLCKESSPLLVSRVEIEDLSVANYGQTEILYRLALRAPAGLVGVYPMTYDAGSLERLGIADIIEKLPDDLTRFYDTVLGMSLAASTGLDSNCYDLPTNISRRRPFEQFWQRLGLSAKMRGAVEKLAGADANLIVWIWGTVGHHVLLDINRTTDNLFVVSTDPARIPYRLTQPAAALDRYFSNALRGFPEPSVL